PSHMYDVKAGIDASGRFVAMDWTSYGQPNATIDTHLELLGTATWPAVPAAGGPNPSDSAVYTVPQRRVLAKTQPGYAGSLKISALRAPNAPQAYLPSEQIVDDLSRALYEQATWNKDRVTSLDWVSYPILRFKDSPTVTMINVHPGKYTAVRPGDTTQDVQAGNTAVFNNGWLLSGSGEPPTVGIG